MYMERPSAIIDLFLSGLVGAVGIEIASQSNKSWVAIGVAPLPFIQPVSNGVRSECLR
jgi:hypothetical protein